MKEHQFASQNLLTSLSSIAEQLKQTQCAEGKWLRKEKADGYDLEWTPDSPNELGRSKVTFINVEVDLWRELGFVLEMLANGEDARRLFRQHLRTKPAKDGEHRLRALAYWYARARNPEANDAEALQLAREVVSTTRILKRETLRKYAQRHRERCLCLLAFHPNWVFTFETSDIEIHALGPDIAPLVRYLRKKEDREKWHMRATFQVASDVLYIRSKNQADVDHPAFPGMSLHAEDLPPGSVLRLKKRDALLTHMSVTYERGRHPE